MIFSFLEGSVPHHPSILYNILYILYFHVHYWTNIQPINCRSLYGKLDEVINIYKSYDIIACTETWLTHSHTESMLTFPDKTIFRLDRQTKLANGLPKKGGGICIYVDARYSKFCTALPSCTMCCEDFEIMTISLCKPGTKFMNISVIYKPPKTNAKLLIDFLKQVHDFLIPRNREIWFLGDFNIDFLVRDNANTKKIVTYFRNNGLTQLVSEVSEDLISIKAVVLTGLSQIAHLYCIAE